MAHYFCAVPAGAPLPTRAVEVDEGDDPMETVDAYSTPDALIADPDFAAGVVLDGADRWEVVLLVGDAVGEGLAQGAWRVLVTKLAARTSAARWLAAMAAQPDRWLRDAAGAVLDEAHAAAPEREALSPRSTE